MPDPVYRFGPFRLDPQDRRLTHGGAPVEVSARYLDALILLVAEGGRLVTKERFMDEVWRGIPVTDEALTQCIRSLRRALDDDASAPRYIETVPRHGYRFGAPVEIAEDSGPEPALVRAPSPRLAVETLTGALGGGIAGMVAALGYVSMGLVGAGIGAASTLLVLLSVNLLLGCIAGGAIGFAVALATSRSGSSSLWSVVAAGGAGALVGALGHMVGNDLFELFFGRSPGFITGGREGFLVGLAAGGGLWFAARLAHRNAAWQAASAILLGLASGFVIAITGGRLMVGSLAELASRFPNSRLNIGREGLSSSELLLATSLESMLFVGCTAAAIIAARRLRTSSHS